MIVEDILGPLGLRVVAGESGLDKPITGGYVGDLLSCVMAGAAAGNIWVTLQGHPNVVAVATLVGLAGIVVTEGARIEIGTLEKANQEGIPVLTSQMSSFEVVARLVGLGVTGKRC